MSNTQDFIVVCGFSIVICLLLLLDRWVQHRRKKMAEEPSITCPACQMTSYNANDIEQGYCGNCHEFTGKGEI